MLQQQPQHIQTIINSTPATPGQVKPTMTPSVHTIQLPLPSQPTQILTGIPAITSRAGQTIQGVAIVTKPKSIIPMGTPTNVVAMASAGTTTTVGVINKPLMSLYSSPATQPATTCGLTYSMSPAISPPVTSRTTTQAIILAPQTNMGQHVVIPQTITLHNNKIPSSNTQSASILNVTNSANIVPISQPSRVGTKPVLPILNTCSPQFQILQSPQVHNAQSRNQTIITIQPQAVNNVTNVNTSNTGVVSGQSASGAIKTISQMLATSQSNTISAPTQNLTFSVPVGSEVSSVPTTQTLILNQHTGSEVNSVAPSLSTQSLVFSQPAGSEVSSVQVSDQNVVVCQPMGSIPATEQQSIPVQAQSAESQQQGLVNINSIITSVSNVTNSPITLPTSTEKDNLNSTGMVIALKKITIKF